jgi:hypothetical protein
VRKKLPLAAKSCTAEHEMPTASAAIDLEEIANCKHRTLRCLANIGTKKNASALRYLR